MRPPWPSFVGTAAGIGLGLAGLVEAGRLARGDRSTLARSARAAGPVRVVAGSLLLVRPHALPVAVGAGSDMPVPEWLVRMVAVREIVLGLGVRAAGRRGRDPGRWLMTAAAIDGAEAVVVLDAIAHRRLAPLPGLGFATADLGGALVAAGVLRQHCDSAVRARRRCEPSAARRPAAPAVEGVPS